MKMFKTLVSATFILGVTLPILGTLAQAQDVPLAIVAARRAQFGTPLTADQTVAFLRSVAADLTARVPGGPYGVLVKTSGKNCAGYSCDIICTGQGPAQQQWDVLVDSDGAARPAWNGPHGVPNIAVRPCEFTAMAPPVPAPMPPPVPVDEELKAQVQELLNRFEQVTAEVAILRSENAALRERVEVINGAHNGQLNNLDGRLTSVETSKYVASIFGVPVKVRRQPIE